MALRLPDNHTGTVRHLTDFFHVAGYVASAANATEGSAATREVRADAWRSILKHHDDGAERVLRSLKYWRGRTPRNKREPIDDAIRFVSNQAAKGRLDYAGAIASNEPIGTGITEAAAKTLVNTRMKKAGARFSQHGGQTVLTFRAAVLSQRFEPLLRQIGATYTADVKAA